MRSFALLVLLVSLAFVVMVPLAMAHPLAPSSLRLSIDDNGLVEARWRTPSVRPIGSELVPRLPSHCRPTTEPQTLMTSDRAAFERRWQADCGERGLIESVVRVEGLSTTSTNVVVEVIHGDGSSARGLLHRGQSHFVVPRQRGRSEVALDFGRLGIEHLLSGPDHVLFVLALLLVLTGWRRLLQAITAFTIGHSLSLALAVLGFLRVPGPPVEVAIALSLLVMALEILRVHRGLAPGPVARWPWAVCAIFGLVHGLGFAGALAHTGLPESAIPLSLLSFNVGIEVGQLLIVVVAFASFAALRRVVRRKLRVPRVPMAYLVGSLSAFWILERSLGL